MGTNEFKTPRRPKYRVNKPQQRGDHILPWTASRCQRLLRPLLSRISLLRKSATNLPCPDTLPQSLPSPTRPAVASESCAWLAPRKKLRRTYSQRGANALSVEGPEVEPVRFKAARDLQRESHTGEIVAFTPLLRRVRGHQMSSPIQGSEPVLENSFETESRFCKRDAKLEDWLVSLRTHVSPARYTDYEAVFRATEALLNVVSQRPSRKGASSFLDMCLRKVPHYIAGVKAWEVHEAELSGTRTNTTGADTGSRIYSELESLGSFDDGWTHLRTATEAEAMNVLVRAMAEGLFPDEFSMILIELCSNYGVKQLDELLDTFTSRPYPRPLSLDSKFSEISMLRPLSFLRDISIKTGRPSMMLQQISVLLARGSLHYTWLAIWDFKEIWASAFEMISKGRAALDAVDFLATSVILLCRNLQISPNQKLPDSPNELITSCQQLHITTLAILAAMRRLSQDELFANKSPNPVKVARIGRGIGFTLNACIGEIESWKGRRGKPRVLLYLAMFLSSPISEGERFDNLVAKVIEATNGSNEERLQFMKRSQAMISLLSGTAKICGRGTTLASRHYLAAFCKQLGRLGLPTDLLETINKTGAFTLAEQSNDLRDLLYAESLVSGSASTGGDGCHQGSRKPMLFEGFRWDASISEWVTASPTTGKKTQRNKTLRSSARAHHGRMSDPFVDRTSLSPSRSTGSTGHVATATSSDNIRISGQGRLGSASQDSLSSITISDTTPMPRHQKHANHYKKRHSEPHAAKNTTFDDELCDNKENQGQVVKRKRYGSEVRRPLGRTRRVRLSGGGVHSDDELGV
ncbi:hypothetical protein PFICI_05262 [Pestalotiopsis fici W106-1]|uniref:Uncharacterized protein n=1 Tax=Pestalotiopsis fici (strain W106-1 / CGMCC3.15140) TaxID=1229662 RepID=W3XDW0_PESFW|nr:uncharacterized protein PFICI_05262 [Pestalotiopsis fici W106-1]ETS83386.1 hypothetical protein PFICI_05262 [Pestalotiopsis fici W106-1]